ncbi:hypothetical protein CHE218_10550 [Microbacterium sp. che218]
MKYRTRSASRGTRSTATIHSATPPRRVRRGAADTAGCGAVEMREASADPGRDSGEGVLMRTA